MAPDSPSMRTQLARVRGLGSARSGTQHFWHQRLTGVALAPLAVTFVWIVLSVIGRDYNTVHAMVANPLVAILLAAFILAGVYHMQIGMQVILEDYIHAPNAKIVALIGNIFFSIILGLGCLYAVLKISFT